MPGSGAAVEIETHWLGGRRHYENWEIADIAVAIMVRQQGRLVIRKIALLQSKRLYSREIFVREDERIDYMIGIGRFVDNSDTIVTLTNARLFSFLDECVYGQITAGSNQSRRIDEYAAARNIPVYYSLYNPALVPMTSTVPRMRPDPEPLDILLGCRVLTAGEVHAVLGSMPVGQRPCFSALVRQPAPGETDPFAAHGWRLEQFIADEVLNCREGRLFEKADDIDLHHLLTARGAPISAAIVITIDLPGGD
jgi:hypothetical protein